MSWEPSPSVETHGSYGFGFFPQFSVGLVWPGTLFSHLWNRPRCCRWSTRGSGLGLPGTRGLECSLQGTRLSRGPGGPSGMSLPSAHLLPPSRGRRTRTVGVFR